MASRRTDPGPAEVLARDRSVTFSFDGRSLPAVEGDTVGSALAASDVSVISRSFKYHRPRGPALLHGSMPELPRRGRWHAQRACLRDPRRGGHARPLPERVAVASLRPAWRSRTGSTGSCPSASTTRRSSDRVACGRCTSVSCGAPRVSVGSTCERCPTAMSSSGTSMRTWPSSAAGLPAASPRWRPRRRGRASCSSTTRTDSAATCGPDRGRSAGTIGSPRQWARGRGEACRAGGPRTAHRAPRRGDRDRRVRGWAARRGPGRHVRPRAREAARGRDRGRRAADALRRQRSARA